MSPDPDRIAVPTNGRGPHHVPDSLPAAAQPDVADVASSGGPSEEEMSVAFSPKQLAVGFAILASIIVLLAGRARRRR